MPPKNYVNLSVKYWIMNRLESIGKAMKPPKKAATLAQEILATWLKEHDKKVKA